MDSSDFEQRLIKTFVTRYEEDVKSDTTWAAQWSSITGAETFKNFYLLRDFLYSDKTFMASNGEETAVSNDHVEFIDEFHRLFMESPVVSRFFQDKAQAWEASSTPQNDGSDLIIKNLELVANNHTRTQRYLQIIEQARRTVLQEMSKFHHSDQADEQIRSAVMQCGQLTMAMDTLFDVDKIYTSLFGKFMERIAITEEEIYRHFHNKIRAGIPKERTEDRPYHLLFDRAKGISKEKTYEENLEIVRKAYSFASTEDTERHFEEMKIDLHRLFFQRSGGLDNKSDILANAARAFWFDNKLVPENFQHFLDMGLRESSLENLFRNLKISFDKLLITDVIAAQIRSYVDRYSRVDAAEDMIAHITAGIINEFVSSLGWTYFSESEKEKVASIEPVIADLVMDFPMEEETFKPVDRPTLEKLYSTLREINEDNKNNERLDATKTDYIPMIRNYRRWTGLLKILFISNCDIPVYDPVANQKIGETLDQIKQHEFSI
ncbi:MAG: virulence factor SrfC family protein [Bacteroidota bacterium]